MKRSILLLWVISLLVGCSDSSLSGGPAQSPQSEQVDEQPKSEGEGNDGEHGFEFEQNDDLEFEEQTEESIEDLEVYEEECLGQKGAVQDPNETYVFPGGKEVRDFVNDRCQVNVPDIGMMHNSQETADIICQLKGFKEGVITSSGSYSSPHDNFIAHWDDATKSMVQTGATGWNTKIHGLTCKGRMIEKCALKQVKLDCN
jgi:hypothetical protein